jgi:hypothetical protein
MHKSINVLNTKDLGRNRVNNNTVDAYLTPLQVLNAPIAPGWSLIVP